MAISLKSPKRGPFTATRLAGASALSSVDMPLSQPPPKP
jgi:hypothetical protein